MRNEGRRSEIWGQIVGLMGGGGGLWPWREGELEISEKTEVAGGRSGVVRNVGGGGGRRGSVKEEGTRHNVPAVAVAAA